MYQMKYYLKESYIGEHMSSYIKLFNLEQDNMGMNSTVAFIEVKLGRKELEEYIQTKNHSTLLNKRP